MSINPEEVTLEVKETHQFSAVGFDEYGNAIQGLAFNWAVVAGGGVIDQDGVFTAGPIGQFPSTLRATASQDGLSRTGSASVIVVPALAVAAGTVGGTPYAFFRSGSFLVATDVTDPVSPGEVGRLLLPGVVQGLFFRESDGLLFVANRFSGLRVVDVSDPSAPVEIGSLDTPGSAQAVTVVAGLAYGGRWVLRPADCRRVRSVGSGVCRRPGHPQRSLGRLHGRGAGLRSLRLLRLAHSRRGHP